MKEPEINNQELEAEMALGQLSELKDRIALIDRVLRVGDDIESLRGKLPASTTLLVAIDREYQAVKDRIAAVVEDKL